MRTISAGSRDTFWPFNFDYIDAINAAVAASGFSITEVVSGNAPGADRWGIAWAKGVGLPYKTFPADWKNGGKQAGFQRNERMGNYADALIAVWDGRSRGTEHMIDYARTRGLKVHVYIPPF